MAQRFTETNKWKDGWFSSLDRDQKLFWLYLLDDCDNAGIWEKNFRAAAFFMDSDTVTESWAMTFLAGKAIPISDSKWFIPRFVEFQYGELKESCKPHASVISKLRKAGIDPLTLEAFQNKDYPKGMNSLKDKDKEQDQEKDKEKDKDAPQGIVSTNLTINTVELHQARMQKYPEISEMQKKWNEFAVKHGLAKIETIPTWRLANIVERMKEPEFNFDKILSQIEKQPFLLGKTDAKWKLSFDKVVGDNRYYVQILEGVHIPAQQVAAVAAASSPVKQSAPFIEVYCIKGHHIGTSLRRTDLEKNLDRSVTCKECGSVIPVRDILAKEKNGTASFAAEVDQ